MFDPMLGQEFAKGHFLRQLLREAIAEQQLAIVYQPIMSVSKNCCVAMEALVRWDHPSHGKVPPSEFIPLAERSGDIFALGRWVLQEACRTAAMWTGEDAPAVSVNVSAAQILAGELVGEVLEAVRQSGLPPHRLHLELTESSFAGDFDFVAPVLAQLRNLGVHISLDDFGTGFSSLAYLQQLKIDTIKIDKAFVWNMRADSDSILQAIVSIARALGCSTIAEGVETEDQRVALRGFGVDLHQGFYYSQPLAGGDVQAWLNRHPTRPTYRVRRATPALALRN
jgi:EAL domain-containing protein (putative c-di-GMP-specific phosphodiesterase class I)